MPGHTTSRAPQDAEMGALLRPSPLRFKVHGKRGFRQPESCSICYENFRLSEEALALPCSSFSSCPSVFHHKCLSAWLTKEGSCPLCRRLFSGLGPPKQPAAPYAPGPTAVRASFSLANAGSYVPSSASPLGDRAVGTLESWLRRFEQEGEWLSRLEEDRLARARFEFDDDLSQPASDSHESEDTRVVGSEPALVHHSRTAWDVEPAAQARYRLDSLQVRRGNGGAQRSDSAVARNRAPVAAPLASASAPSSPTPPVGAAERTGGEMRALARSSSNSRPARASGHLEAGSGNRNERRQWAGSTSVRWDSRHRAGPRVSRLLQELRARDTAPASFRSVTRTPS